MACVHHILDQEHVEEGRLSEIFFLVSFTPEQDSSNAQHSL
jgi:hypothetical protein